MSVKYHDQTVAGLTEFDTTPTQGSVKAVTSNGIATALAGKQNNLTFDATPTSGSSNPVTSNGINVALGSKVEKTDLTSIQATGGTNTTDATIAAEKYFYLNGLLVQAKADIASGAAFTLNTNYAVVTGGGINSVCLKYVDFPFTFSQKSAGTAGYETYTADLSGKNVLFGIVKTPSQGASQGLILMVANWSTNSVAVHWSAVKAMSADASITIRMFYV